MKSFLSWGGGSSKYYEYVDMGDAGYWATCNIGASSPEDFGLYFAWGETTGYPDITIDRKFTWNDYKFGPDINNLTKYNSIDGLTTLEPEDDAAHVIMKDNWKIPTQQEFAKLFSVCNSEFISNYHNICSGRLLTLKTDNSKQLFFPCGGYLENNLHYAKNATGAYWYATVLPNEKAYAWIFWNSGNNLYNPSNRLSGCTIRAFIPKT